MEKAKSAALALLVALSLVQSYFLMYGLPSLGAESQAEGYYPSAEVPGSRQSVEQLVFPERIILHMGEQRHTVFFPDHLFYELIYEKLKGRVFRGFQRISAASVDWAHVRAEEAGVELRFAKAVPFELLQRVFKLEGDFLFSRDAIEKIWIFAPEGREDVRAFLFGGDGENVYEVLRVDMTAGDVRQFVGFGEYWPAYRFIDDHLYIPERALTYLSWTVPIRKYRPEQMEGSLFFDPGATRMTYSSKDGSQIFTDGKRGLKVEQNGAWLVYTDPVAVNGGASDPLEQLRVAVEFVNRHGGWDGVHLLVPSADGDEGETIRFQQYFRGLPVLPGSDGVRFGHMQLTVRQGEVAQYERPLIVMEGAGADESPTSAAGSAGVSGSGAAGAGDPDGEAPESGAPKAGENGADGKGVSESADGSENGAVQGSGHDGVQSGQGGAQGENAGGPANAQGKGAAAAGPSAGAGLSEEGQKDDGPSDATEGGENAETEKAPGTAAGGEATPADGTGPTTQPGSDTGSGSARPGIALNLSYGDDLLRQIRAKAQGQKVESLVPAYRAVLHDDHIRLMPVWAIRLVSGEWRLLDG
jgi:regulatory protein YycH of two-component signal transduction system YycFG